MLITDFDFELPDALIAQEPLKNREKSRMLVVDRASKSYADEHFYNLPKFLKKGDVVVLNNTRVFPARLFGASETGAKIELFLVRETEDRVWETLARPARRLKTGKKILFGEDLRAEVLDKTAEGRVFVRFEADGDFDEILERLGKTPLPPYIKREDDDFDKDRERYQTVFARQRGAIAAPTAGLHFTPQILEEIKDSGASIAEITLHVGYGTFEPVRVSDLSEHQVLPENYEIPAETAEILNRAKAEDRRIIAIGTTTTRALESNISRHKTFAAEKTAAGLTITPGYKFRAISGLLTNFHLPQSSLLVLVSTFGGYELIMESYQHAVAEKYRFYSYGDCMLIC
jgi:S-adenosylmethionine:tRNA ribosyltransferase-isomerase